MEDIASAWLLDLLGLPAESAVGFVTGATMANFTCLAAARNDVLRRAGWDVAARGLAGAPRVRVLVGSERHETIDLTLRYLGLGTPQPVAVDDQGRLDPEPLRIVADGTAWMSGSRTCLVISRRTAEHHVGPHLAAGRPADSPCCGDTPRELPRK